MLSNLFSSLKQNKKTGFIVLIALFALAVLSAVIFILKSEGVVVNNKEKEIAEEDAVKVGERALDGVKVDPGKENLRPYAIMIENHVDARPQSGLSEASLVIEVVAEGGITRFLAFFDQDVELEEIGPVRSARSYYLDWVSEIRPAYVHYGGETLTITQIPEYGILDINGMYLSGQYFWRANYSPAPHNAYTSTQKLSKMWDQFDWDKEAEFTAWEFKEDAPVAIERVESMKFNFSNSYVYNASWKYSPETNGYLRSQAGVPHTDRLTKEQYQAKVVIAQLTRIGVRDKEGHMGIETIGGGKALIFQDGTVEEGFWRKNSRQERTFFYDANWQPMEFNRGLLWVEVLEEGDVSY